MIDPQSNPGAGKLVRALLFRDSEVQTSRLLDVALEQDLGNGVLLARTLLESVADGPAGAQAAALLRTLPTQLRAWTEVPLRDLRVGQAQRHDKQQGWVDLVLQDPEGDWVLAVEIKVKAGYGANQLETYSELGVPLVGLVMVAGAPSATARSLGPGWLGEATWEQVQKALYGFSWPLGGQEIWVECLDDLYLARDTRDRTEDDAVSERLLCDLVPHAAQRLEQVLELHRPDRLDSAVVHHRVMLETLSDEPDADSLHLGFLSATDDMTSESASALVLTVEIEYGRLSHVVAIWTAGETPPAISTTRPYERYVAGGLCGPNGLAIPITHPEIEARGTVPAAMRAIEPLLRVVATDLWDR